MHLWKKFLICNAVLRVSKRKKLQNPPLGALLSCVRWNLYQSALILSNVPCPEIFLIVHLHDEVWLVACLNKITVLRAKITFKIWYFYLAQILTWIVEKQHVLTSFNFFFKFSYCLTLFPIISVHVNLNVFYVTEHLFKFYHKPTLHKICLIVTET